MKPNLDKVLEEKIKPIISDATSKFLGVHINELNEDISSKLTKSILADIEIDFTLNFKDSKKKFKKAYIRKILQLKLGNITEVARVTGTNRRSIHRLIKELNIDIDTIKKELLKPYNIKVHAVSHAIENVLENYKGMIHPDRLEQVYENVGTISEDILKGLPEKPLTLKEAEHEFEKQYLKKLLKKNNNNVSKTAKKIGLRYETLHRKIKLLKI